VLYRLGSLIAKGLEKLSLQGAFKSNCTVEN